MNQNLYIKNQSEEAKLIYTTQLLWAKINAQLNFLFNSYDLNITKFNILMAIKHSSEGQAIEIEELKKDILVCSSKIDTCIDELEKSAHITRENNVLKVTQATSSLLDEIWVKYEESLKIITNGLKDEDKVELRNKMLEWIINIK